MMTNDMADLAKLAQYIAEARSMGIEVLPPDVNESGVFFEPAHTKTQPADHSSTPRRPIRFGLAAVKGVGEIAVETLLEARRSGGRFTTLFELCERVDTRVLNRRVLEALIRSGACDGLGETRATLMSIVDRGLARASSLAADRQRGQGSLFDQLTEGDPTTDRPFDRLPELPASELLAAEKELLGFYVTGHPLLPHASLVERYGLATTGTLAQLPNRAMTRIGGLIAVVQQGFSKKSGKPYALVTLEDLEGTVQLLCMNESYEQSRPFLEVNRPVLVIGEVSQGEDKPKIFPQEILPLEDAPKRFTRQVHLRFQVESLTPERLERARELAAAYPGRVPLFLCLEHPTGAKVFIEAHERYAVTPGRELQQALSSALGEEVYHPAVDNTLPERAPRRWERREGNGEGSRAGS